ncbi:hypothetical protein [Zavarzinia sp.]|uniref:hypothetical protein n=1 Tax=Zavarzinia sp. TaxID=2027920 RepID=UPI003569162E
MAIRSFGAVNGAGTAVREGQPRPPIQAAALGVGCFIGPFERGLANGVTYAPNEKAFARRLGGRIGADATTGASVVPDCAQDYWLHGGGAGELVCVRVTDGHEVASDLKLYSRHWGTGFGAAQSDLDGQAQIKLPLLQIKAKNGGRWGGRARKLRAAVSATGKITATTIDTETVMLANEWKGATLELDAVSGKTYKVLSNNAAGVLTVETGATMATDMGANVDLGYSLSLGAKVETNGVRKALAVKVINATIDPGNEFGLEIYVDGDRKLVYSDLAMDSASPRYFKSVINDDPLNFEVEAVDLWNGSTPNVPDIRPANWYGMPSAIDSESITFLPFQVTSVEDAKVSVVGVEFGTAYEGLPVKLTFTWALGTTKYVVTATGLYGKSVVTSLPDFTVGAGEQIAKQYNPGATHAKWLKWLPKITIDHTGGAPADTKKFVVEIAPLPSAVLPGAYVLPDAKSKPLTAIRVRSATYRKVTLDGDPTVAGLAPVQAVVTGTVAEGAGFAVVAGNNDKLLLSADGRKDVEVTLTAGAAVTTAAIVAEINAAFDLVYAPAGSVNPASVYTDDAGDKFLRLSSAWYEGGGKRSSIAIKTQLTHAYTILGLSVAVTQGTNGTEAGLQFADECGGGYDGAAPADADYLAALAIGSSPLNKVPHSKGVLLTACPDVTSTAVQQAGLAYAAAKAHLFEVIEPANKLNDQDAIDFIDTTIGRGEDASTLFPSYGNVRDPDKSGVLKSVPLVGSRFGLDAKYAAANGHYCAPAAGVDAVLQRVISLPTGEDPVNGEALNPKGLNVVKFRGTTAVVWGGRTLAGATGEKFRSKRLQLSHYIHTLLDQFDYVVFALNDPDTRDSLKTDLRTFFVKEWQKRALRGNAFDDACLIKIDDENNTAADEDAGNLNAEIAVRITGFAERVIFTIGKMGVSENVSA